MNMEKQFYTAAEVKGILNLTWYTVYALINQPDLPKIKIGKTCRIPVNEFNQFIKSYLGKDLKL